MQAELIEIIGMHDFPLVPQLLENKSFLWKQWQTNPFRKISQMRLNKTNVDSAKTNIAKNNAERT